jgi:hypothetical protein
MVALSVTSKTEGPPDRRPAIRVDHAFVPSDSVESCWTV